MTNLTQEDQILLELKKAGSMGLHPTFIIEVLHIFQYSARINGLRKRFNCQCKNGVHCSSDEHIVNKRLPDGTTKFFYENNIIDWEKMRREAIKERDEVPFISSDQLKLV